VTALIRARSGDDTPRQIRTVWAGVLPGSDAAFRAAIASAWQDCRPTIWPGGARDPGHSEIAGDISLGAPGPWGVELTVGKRLIAAV
jgi:hypothetical protein